MEAALHLLAQPSIPPGKVEVHLFMEGLPFYVSGLFPIIVCLCCIFERCRRIATMLQSDCESKKLVRWYDART